MMKHWIRFFCLSLLTIVTGIASAQDVIEISTVQGLKEFRDAVNSGTNYAGKTVELTNDLDLQGQNWVPIGIGGGTSKSFCGTFDGKGHTISNLSCNYQKYAGLFGSFYGIVKNLTMKDVNMVSTHYAGGIVAFLGSEAGKNITNCTVSGGTISSVPELVNDSYDNGDKVGGILGYMAGKDYVANCIVENVTIKGYRDLGGIVGMANGTSSVSGCSATNITIIQDNENGYKSYAEVKDLAGGIVGRASANATVSDNTSSNITITHVNYGVAKIGDVEYETIAAAVAAANEGNVIQIIKAGDYTLPTLSKNVTIEGKADGVVSFTHTTAGSVASIPNGATFKNVTFNFGNVNYHGFQNAGTINMEGCTLNGKFFSYADMNFTDCSFVNKDDYNMWVYGAGNVVYDKCTFSNSTTGRLLHLYCEGINLTHKVTVKDCNFYNKGSLNNAAINVKATSTNGALQYELHLKGNNTVDGNFPTAVGEQDNSDHTWILSRLVQVDKRSVSPDNIKVYENDKLIYPVSYVAQIGNVKYESLAKAVAAVKDGETILMLADVPNAGGMSVSSGKNFTVDFNGHTYTLNKPGAGSTGTETNGFQLLKNSTIVFKNGTINISEENLTKAVDPAKNIMRIIQNYANLTLENMTIDGTNQYGGKDYIMSFNNGTSVIKDTKVVGADKIAFDVCTWSSYKATSLDVTGNSEIKGDIEISSTNTPDALSLMLTSGTHDGAIIMAQGADKATVSKVNEFVQAAPDGYKWVDNGDDTSTLAPAHYVAQIGDVKYESLQEAVNAAGTNAATITLLTDAATDGVITGNGVKVQAGQNITFDLKGLTYNVDKTVGSAGTETNGFQLLKGSTVKFTNGTLTSATAQILLQNYSDLTLDGVTVNAGSADYAVSNNFGSLTVTGETYINAKEGGVAFDLWYGMNENGLYDDGIQITFDENFTGKVTGKVEYGHASRVTDENWQEKASLVIKAGEFDIEYANGSAGALNVANIKISGGNFLYEVPEAYCAEGYVPVELENGRYSVQTKEEAGIFELIDGEPYERTADVQAKKVTYTRTFPYQVSGNLQCWVVPFDYEITKEDLQNLSFYKTHLISAVESATGGLVEDDSKIYLYYQSVEAGTVLKANKPYFVKVNEKTKENKTFTFAAENVTLKAKNDDCLLNVSTSRFNFDFYAAYVSGFKPEAEHWLGVNQYGSLFWNKPTSKLASSYRWYIKVTDNENDYAKITFELLEEGDATTTIENGSVDSNADIEGFYTVGGVKLNAPAKGLNIVKYTDGTTKKVYIKK